MVKSILRWIFGDPKAAIIEALYPSNELSGLQLGKVTGFGVGRLYPALHSLEKEGAIVSRWSDRRDDRRGLARRRLYSLSKKGRKMRVEQQQESNGLVFDAP